jgi:phage terminase large subunit-like protein
MSGRGFGKTECGAQWTRSFAESGQYGSIALIGQTASAVREVMVERVLSIAPRWAMPVYEASRARMRWPNGCIALCYSADQPERLRGPQHAAAWIDELASFRRADDVWSTLLLGLRVGADPRICITTTPKPTRLIRDLVSREQRPERPEGDVVITRGASRENAANLAPGFLSELASRYAGTRIGRQELDGELLEDVPGALWSHELIEATRVETAPSDLERIVIGIDPAGSSEDGADETGVIACARGRDGHAYTIADYSGRFTPVEWARVAVRAFHALRADRIAVERNFGGDMVLANIAAVDPAVPVKAITSSRGKVLRAEPIASIFEQGRAHLVGDLSALEDQMSSFTADWNRARDGSPDRVDAMVFALTELMLGEAPGGFIKPDALLAPIETGSAVRAPIEQPRVLDGLFASVAAGVGPEPDSVGVIFFGIDVCGNAPAPLVVLDWSLFAVEDWTLQQTFPWLAGKFRDLTGEIQFIGAKTGARVGATLLEPQGLGAILYETGTLAGYEPDLIENEAHLKMTPAQRAVAAAAFVGSQVLVTRPAHEGVLEHRGVTRNHFLHAIADFGVGKPPEQASPLLIAFANGVLEAFRAPELARRRAL